LHGKLEETRYFISNCKKPSQQTIETTSKNNNDAMHNTFFLVNVIKCYNVLGIGRINQQKDERQ